MPRRKRKQLDIRQSLERYRNRLEKWPASAFETLRDAYLSSYEVYSTINRLEDHDTDRLRCFASTLMEIARSKGVPVRGVTSERKTRGEYIVRELDGLPRDQVTCVYVGRYSYFGGCERSPFAPEKEDYVYLKEEEETSGAGCST